jgi:tRNA(fMet)-specific endonuclease VapC
MDLILDTNALTALADGDLAAAQVLARASQPSIPVVVLGEYGFGIARSRRKREYELWLADFVAVSRVLDVNEDTATWYARIRTQLENSGTPVPSNDTWITALSRQHSIPILSRDRHFDRVQGVQRLGW